jgi:CHAT domain-containing protein
VVSRLAEQHKVAARPLDRRYLLLADPRTLPMPSFYRSLRRIPDKAQALRSAQLMLLKELRAGTVKVAGASGPITLREHPVLWAGFVLVGQP